jgi:GMP synthase-like glutamine amidotransferase
MRVLVFQHIDVEHPGSFRDLMAADGMTWNTVEWDEGETPPAPEGYDLLMAMGGPMDVWEDARLPWLAAEKDFIRHWVRDLNKPFLGLCLGHQLLAAALGATVGPMARPEVGLTTVSPTPEAAADPVMAALPLPIRCLQWHGSEVKDLPDGGVVLAANPACPIQAMRVGTRAYGFQYHVEVTPATVPEWSRVPAYAASLAATLGADGAAAFAAQTAAALPDLTTGARIFWRAFTRAVGLLPE